MPRSSHHIDKVLETAQSSSAAARSRLAASWRRSAVKHGLDPGEHRGPDRVEARELIERRERHRAFLHVATPCLDNLFTLVGQSGCAVFLTDGDGVILDQRLQDADHDAFDSWGLSNGADWSEAREGTNGIGTCLAENRRVIIHRDQHFFARNTEMSCIDAPIYGAEGEIIGALDVSSARADQTEGFNMLIAAQVSQTARAIEEANFRATYDTSRIVVADGDGPEGAMLLAVDQDDLVVGATREARKLFDLGEGAKISPRPASDLLGRRDTTSGFERAERAALIRALARAGGNASEAARQLGVGRATLYRRMKRLEIDKNRSDLSRD